jgi:hypothetical protein
MKTATGIGLENDDNQVASESLEDINVALAPVGARICRQDWSGLSDDLKTFLSDPNPSPERVTGAMPYVLQSRERLLETIAAAGREPHVPGGGDLTTFDETNGVRYPQLYVARAGADFSRFDRMHVNTAPMGRRSTTCRNFFPEATSSCIFACLRKHSQGASGLSHC